MITYIGFGEEQKVCNFLNELNDKGYDLSKDIIAITEDRGYYTIFYNEKYNENSQEEKQISAPKKNSFI